MTCHDARDLFSARVDGLLTAEQRVALEGHLQSCADCAREWDRFSRTVSLLHSVPEARAPAGFAARVLEAAGREPWPRRLLRNVFVPLHVKLPLEAAAIVLVSTLVIFLYRQTPELQRAAEAPPSAGIVTQASEAPAKSADVEQAQGYGKTAAAPQAAPPPAEERQGALQDVKERDRLAKKQEAAPAEPPAVGGRLDATREAQKSVVPRSELKTAARAQGPFHLMGLLRPKSLATLDAELNGLVKEVGGVLVRDADRVGPGSIVEVVVPRDAYPRLEAGLRQLGDFTVETRAQTFPDQVRIGLRIAQ
ncbi:MAG: zf-HC2 domain-containing protein [Candidatus Rokubacteria bacterium]|nr:zf-HC2 domain-containing protein [Candidatus Rokubacteria bacterium]